MDGIVRIPALVETVAAAGMPACAVTEQSNLFSLVKFYRGAQNSGIKPIIGVDLWVCGDEGLEQPSRLVMLCQSEVGFRSLSRLITRSYSEGQVRGVPMVRHEWLDGNVDGLIALSAGVAGDVGQMIVADRAADAQTRLEKWLKLFPDRYYLELQRIGREGEELCIHASVELATRVGVPVVATNDVRFIAVDDFEAHEARVCIHEGRTLDDPRRPKTYSAQQYLRTPEEMSELFDDLPEAIENSVEIARRCNVELELGKDFLPEFPLPEGVDLDEHLIDQSRNGLVTRFETDIDVGAEFSAEHRSIYNQRLEREL